MIDSIQWSTGAATGGAGVATATGYSPPMQAEILAVNVAYIDSPPAGTTDFTLADENDPASENIVTLANAATDTKLYPRRQVQDNTDTDLTLEGTEPVTAPYVVNGRLAATIAQANNGDSVTVTAWIKR